MKSILKTRLKMYPALHKRYDIKKKILMVDYERCIFCKEVAYILEAATDVSSLSITLLYLDTVQRRRTTVVV